MRIAALSIVMMSTAAAQAPLPPDAYLSIVATKKAVTVMLEPGAKRGSTDWGKVLAKAVPCPLGDPEDGISVSCSPIPRAENGRALHIETGILRHAFQQNGATRLYVWINAPKYMVELHGFQMRESHVQGMMTYFRALDALELPDAIDVRTGEASGRLPLFLSALASLLCGVLLTTAVVVHRVSTSTDPVADRWMRVYLLASYRTAATWLGLWILCSVFHPLAILEDRFDITSTGQIEVVCALLALTASVNLACAWMAAPLYRSVRRLDISRAEIIRVELMRDGAIAVVALAFSFLDIHVPWMRSPIAPLLIAAAMATVLGVALRKTIGMRPFALSHGELRDAIFDLAAKGSIALKNLYILPENRWNMVNAFASRGASVMLSEALVNSLSRREVNALAAHELTHLKEGHVGKIGMLTGVAIAIPVTIIVIYSLQSQSAFDYFVYAIVWISLVTPMIKRRYEWRADRGAAEMTGDPEAVITGLARIMRLNYLPLRFEKPWSWFLTHPSTMLRLEAVAERWGIGKDRLAELIDAEPETGVPKYTIDRSSAPDSKLFNTEFKTRAGWAMMGCALAVWVLGSLGGARFMRDMELAWQWQVALYFAAIVGIALFDSAVGNWVSGRQSDQLGRQLKRRLEDRGVLPNGGEPTLVGIQPAHSLRLYEGRFEWDIGFLRVEHGRLIYEGDVARFDIAPTDVAELRVSRRRLGLPAARKIYLSVRCPDGELRSVGLRPLGHRTVRGGLAAVDRLAGRLQAWQRMASLQLRQPVVEIPKESEVTSEAPKGVAKTAMRGLVVLWWVATMALAAVAQFSPAALLMPVGIVVVHLLIRISPLARYRPEAAGTTSVHAARM